jgi:HEAT repeat protein
MKTATQALLLLSILPQPAKAQAPVISTASREANVRSLVDRLWSEDDEQAKADILRAGPRAAPYLIMLLTEVGDEQFHPHFALRKEQEGEAFWRDPTANNPLRKYEITQRLITDCEELLVALSPDYAAPAILRALEAIPVFGQEKMWEQYRLLAQIGRPAVPALIDALLSGHSIAGAPPNAGPIQFRAAMALGEIGDPRALPALESILAPGAGHGRSVFSDAIDKIRSRGGVAQAAGPVAEPPNLRLLVDRLRTEDHEAAKAEILKVGPKATPYLIMMLAILAEQQDLHHFERGKGPGGYDQSWGPITDPIAAKYEITSRLIADTEELLVSISPDQATVALLGFLEARSAIGEEAYWPEVKALVKIGKPAVPVLLDDLAAADSIALELSRASSPPNLVHELGMRIRLRIALALGDIGDDRALPALEQLTVPGGPLAGPGASVKNAIDKIRSKQPR